MRLVNSPGKYECILSALFHSLDVGIGVSAGTSIFTMPFDGGDERVAKAPLKYAQV